MSFRVDENDRQHYIQQSPRKKNKVHRAILPRMTPPTKTDRNLKILKALN